MKLDPIKTIAFAMLGGVSFRLILIPYAEHSQRELQCLGVMALVAGLIFAYRGSATEKKPTPAQPEPPAEESGSPAEPVLPRR